MPEKNKREVDLHAGWIGGKGKHAGTLNYLGEFIWALFWGKGGGGVGWRWSTKGV